MAKPSTIGVGIDYSASCKMALKWAIDHLIDAGDTIVLLLVLSPNTDPVNADTGSRLIPLVELNDIRVCRKYGVTLDSDLFNMLHLVSTAKRANVMAKVFWGDPKEKLCEAVSHLKLDAIVIGSKGQDGPVLPGTSLRCYRKPIGSVTSYVVRIAKCPVTVVK